MDVYERAGALAGLLMESFDGHELMMVLDGLPRVTYVLRLDLNKFLPEGSSISYSQPCERSFSIPFEELENAVSLKLVCDHWSDILKKQL